MKDKDFKNTVGNKTAAPINKTGWLEKSAGQKSLKPDFTLFDLPESSFPESRAEETASAPAPGLNQPRTENPPPELCRELTDKARFEAEVKARIEAKLNPQASKSKKFPPLKRNIKEKNESTPEAASAPRIKDNFIISFIKGFFKLILAVVLLIWVFVLGVLVGRQSIFEVKEAHELAAIIENGATKAMGAIVNNAPKPQPPSPEPPAPKAGPETDHGFLDNQAVFKELVAANNKALTDQLSTVSSRPPSENTISETGLKPPGPAVKDGRYIVQALSTSSEGEAQAQVEKLIKKGYASYYYQEGSRFQVRIGRYQTREEANQARRELELLGYNGPYVSKMAEAPTAE